MALQTVKMQFTGTAPLIMHNNQTANPLNLYTRALKKLTGKRQKTEADHLEIARLEWEAGLYLQDGLVVMPAVNIWACLIEGGKKSKRGVKIKSGTNIEENFCPLTYKGPKIIAPPGNGDLPRKDLDQFFGPHSYQTIVKVNRMATLRTRPIFHDWSLGFTVYFDNTVLEAEEILLVAQDAGRLVGLGDWRPRMGRFEAALN